MSDEVDKKMSIDTRDKQMSDMASAAAEAFCKKYFSSTTDKNNPEEILKHTVPYITVRTLHRHEKALKSLEADSRWIKFLTIVLVILTAVLAYYALDAVIHSLTH